MCDKKPFSKNNAHTIKTNRKLSRITKKHTRAYFCKDCCSYHLTTHKSDRGED